eukprot:gene16823-81_t
MGLSSGCVCDAGFSGDRCEYLCPGYRAPKSLPKRCQLERPRYCTNDGRMRITASKQFRQKCGARACTAGPPSACNSNGKCLADGNCQCTNGYSGWACEVSPGNLQEECDAGWRLFKDGCYRLVATPMKWAEAEKFAQEENGHISSINSDEEWVFLHGLTKLDFWIGLHKPDNADQFTWSDSSDYLESDWDLWIDGSENLPGRCVHLAARGNTAQDVNRRGWTPAACNKLK